MNRSLDSSCGDSYAALSGHCKAYCDFIRGVIADFGLKAGCDRRILDGQGDVFLRSRHAHVGVTAVHGDDPARLPSPESLPNSARPFGNAAIALVRMIRDVPTQIGCNPETDRERPR
jgi:hypothetical protein